MKYKFKLFKFNYCHGYRLYLVAIITAQYVFLCEEFVGFLCCDPFHIYFFLNLIFYGIFFQFQIDDCYLIFFESRYVLWNMHMDKDIHPYTRAICISFITPTINALLCCTLSASRFLESELHICLLHSANLLLLYTSARTLPMSVNAKTHCQSIAQPRRWWWWLNLRSSTHTNTHII